MEPDCKEVGLKAGLEVVGMLILVMPMAYIYVIAARYDPYHRGFFCDDENLKHPYLEQTVPIVVAFVIWAVLSIITIVLVETLRSVAEKSQGSRREKPIPGNPTPWIAVELYRHLGYFTLGALTCLLFTEIAKYTVGRLRPHYLTLCDPVLDESLCKDEFKYNKFVILNEEEQCRGLKENGGNYTKKNLHEARLSFMSGHSSFSFYCATFLVVYLQARLTNFPQTTINYVRLGYRIVKVLRPFIQFGMLILAFWISLTRISNYFHHPMDVVTGALVGIMFAAITLLIIADVFNKKSAFWRTLQNLQNSKEQNAVIPKNTAAVAELEEFRYIDEEMSPRDNKVTGPNASETILKKNVVKEKTQKPANTTTRTLNTKTSPRAKAS